MLQLLSSRLGLCPGSFCASSRSQERSAASTRLLFEKEARREDLKEAVTRFSLTPREVEVLDLILDGMSAAEIAEDLHIAEVTVFDHFKHINNKTNARNRADMLAKIFNWQPALRSNA